MFTALSQNVNKFLCEGYDLELFLVVLTSFGGHNRLGGQSPGKAVMEMFRPVTTVLMMEAFNDLISTYCEISQIHCAMQELCVYTLTKWAADKKSSVG
jgi:hypothetical protein